MPTKHRAWRAALVTALAVITAAGCGSYRAPNAGAGPVRRPTEGFCPPPDAGSAAARATPCVSVDPEQYMRSNHMFQQRKALPPGLAANLAPLRLRTRRQLERLTPAQRLSQHQVTAALIAAGLPADGIFAEKGYAGMTSAGTRVYDIQFGALTVKYGQAVCVYGTTGAASVVVNVGGIIMEGGCLPGPGGH